MTRDVIEGIRRGRQILAEPAPQLESPTADSVGICADRLDKAVDWIVDLEMRAHLVPAEDRPAAMEEMRGLRRELHTIGRLLAQAAQLQIGWARLIGAVPSSYDAHGAMAEAGASTVKVDA